MSLFHHFTLMQLLGELSSIYVEEAKKINGFQPRVEQQMTPTQK